MFFKGNFLVYFTLAIYNNKPLDKKYMLLLSLEESEVEAIEELKQIYSERKLKGKHYRIQSTIHFQAYLSDNIDEIKRLCFDIFERVYCVSPREIIKYQADGFRFS